MDREPEELKDEPIKQGLAETVSISKLYPAIWKGQMQIVKSLVEEKHCNLLLKDDRGATALYI